MNHKSAHMQGKSARKQPKDQHEVLIRELKVREGTLKAVTLSAGAMSAGLIYRLVFNLRNIETLPPPILFSAIYSYFSGTTFSMPSPHALLPSRSSSSPFQIPTFDMSPPVLRMNVYWLTCLVFTGSAFFLAMFSKQIIRDRRKTLGALRSSTLSLSCTNEYFHTIAVSRTMDSIFRLFQVALVLHIVAHIDSMVISVNPNVFAPIVLCGLLYVFGFIGPTLLI